MPPKGLVGRGWHVGPPDLRVGELLAADIDIADLRWNGPWTWRGIRGGTTLVPSLSHSTQTWKLWDIGGDRQGANDVEFCTKTPLLRSPRP
jgi:hypothetical protein